MKNVIFRKIKLIKLINLAAEMPIILAALAVLLLAETLARFYLK